jgi:hypothetical protein
MTHHFVPTVLAAPPDKPMVMWWPHCFDCGAQIASVGGKTFYRATSRDEWTRDEPECATRRTT